MSILFSQGKLQGEERKSLLQEVQTQAKAAVLRAIRPVLRALLEEELTAKLGRGKREPRRVSGQARLIDWQCASCGCRDAKQFTRDGHYRRNHTFCNRAQQCLSEGHCYFSCIIVNMYRKVNISQHKYTFLLYFSTTSQLPRNCFVIKWYKFNKLAQLSSRRAGRPRREERQRYTALRRGEQAVRPLTTPLQRGEQQR